MEIKLITAKQVKEITEAEIRKSEARICKVMDRLRKRISELEERLK